MPLDIRQLARRDLMKPGIWYGWHWSSDGERVGSISFSTVGYPDSLKLSYQWTPHGGEARNVECRLLLARVAGGFGSRPMFLCPDCRRCCAVVYFGGWRFACRKCLNLAYASEAEDGMGRLWRRQLKIERRLSGGGGEWDGWSRPKGMHARTFERLRERIFKIEQAKDALLAMHLPRWVPEGFSW